MSCDSKLANKFVQQCAHTPKKGIIRKWYINWEDIDFTGTQTANKGTKVTALVLNSGAKLYAAEGHEKAAKADHALSRKEYGVTYIHKDQFQVTYDGEEERENVQRMTKGRFVTINERNDKGLAGELSYEIYGLEAGMVLTEDVKNTNENAGTRNITVSSQEDQEESTGAKLFMMMSGTPAENNLAATTAWIAANVYTGS